MLSVMYCDMIEVQLNIFAYHEGNVHCCSEIGLLGWEQWYWRRYEPSLTEEYAIA